METDPWVSGSLFQTLQGYGVLLLFLAISCGVGLTLLTLAWIRGTQRPSAAKCAPYECGFDPLEAVRSRFDVRFFLVAVLFILFDVEVIFLFPWAIAFDQIGWFGFFSMLLFLTILGVGFLYEWRKGALEWE